MTLVRYRPYTILSSFKSEMDKLFNSAFQDYPITDTDDLSMKWRPMIDIKETDDNYLVTAEIPGVEAKDIKISIENGSLVIQGEKIIGNREEDKSYQRIERYSGKFYRQFALPVNIDEKNIKAKVKNGVLELKLPKAKGTTTKYIEVKNET